jgi:hypothetical protein
MQAPVTALENLESMAAGHVTRLVADASFLGLLERALRNDIARRPAARRRLLRAALLVAPALPVAARRYLFRRLHRRLGACRAIASRDTLQPRTRRFFHAIGLSVHVAGKRRNTRFERAPERAMISRWPASY